MQWSQNLCRICGQISESCHFIHSKDVPNVLENKIKKCLNLNVCREDYKPKQICNKCIVKLDDYAEFLDISHATNQKFESLYISAQGCSNNRSYEYSTQKQSVIVSNKQVPDNLDFELYKNTGIILENINVSGSLTDNEMLGLVGNGDYNQQAPCENFDSRLQGHFTPALPPTNVGPTSINTIRCSPKFHNKKVEVIALDDKKRYRSYNNNFIKHSSMSMIDLPSRTKEDEQRPIKRNADLVAVQSDQTVLKLGWRQNASRKKPIRYHHCPHCDKKYLRRTTLTAHLAMHTNIRPYKCDDCSKAFAVKGDLTTHRKMHTDKHKCSFCAKTFAVPSKLCRHLRIHTNDKPFACNFPNCLKAFSDKRNLEGHKPTHTSERKYSCSICMKMFKTFSRLKRHLKCHSAGAMYTCSLCLRRYKYKNNLLSHMKKHNHICPACKIHFGNHNSLIEHVKACRVRI